MLTVKVDCDHWTTDCLSVYIQEQSSRREIGDLMSQLQSSEALVAEFQMTLQQRDSELETLRTIVGLPIIVPNHSLLRPSV